MTSAPFILTGPRAAGQRKLLLSPREVISDAYGDVAGPSLASASPILSRVTPAAASRQVDHGVCRGPGDKAQAVVFMVPVRAFGGGGGGGGSCRRFDNTHAGTSPTSPVSLGGGAQRQSMPRSHSPAGVPATLHCRLRARLCQGEGCPLDPCNAAALTSSKLPPAGSSPGRVLRPRRQFRRSLPSLWTSKPHPGLDTPECSLNSTHRTGDKPGPQMNISCYS